MKTSTKTAAERCYMVGSRWSQISERAVPTMMTKAEAQKRCDELNQCEDVRRGNSPFFVTTRPSFAAE